MSQKFSVRFQVIASKMTSFFVVSDKGNGYEHEERRQISLARKRHSCHDIKILGVNPLNENRYLGF